LNGGLDWRERWKRRRVYVYGGSSVSMPDTRRNPAKYPQPVVQKDGWGFPWRIAAVISPHLARLQ
jgi:hypothetical protein